MAKLWVGRSGISPMTREVYDPSNQAGVKAGNVRLATVHYSEHRKIAAYSEMSRSGARHKLVTETELDMIELVRVIYRDNHEWAWDFHLRLIPLRQSKDPFERYLAGVWPEVVEGGNYRDVREAWRLIKENEAIVQNACNLALYPWQGAAEVLKWGKTRPSAVPDSATSPPA